MKLKSSKTSKSVATKKAKTGRTKAKGSRTSSKPRTSRTLYWLTVGVSNLKDIYLTSTGASLNVSGDLTPTSSCVFCLAETTPSGKEVIRNIRIGQKGLEYRGPSEDNYRMIGWSELEIFTQSSKFEFDHFR